MNQFVYQTQTNQGLSGSSDAPRIPSLSEKAVEAVAYLRESEVVMADIRRRSYGSFPQEAANEEKRPDQSCLDELLTEISQRAACISSELKSILGRL